MPSPSLDPLCPSIQAALELLGRPWTGLVLAVLQDGALRYSEVSTRIPGIGDKTLCARLKELEAKGLVVREVEPGPPVRVAYRLTPKGASFRKVVEAIDAWGREFQAPVVDQPVRKASAKAPPAKVAVTKRAGATTAPKRTTTRAQSTQSQQRKAGGQRKRAPSSRGGGR